MRTKGRVSCRARSVIATGGGAIVDFTDAMDLAGFPQQAFGQRGFAGVDVGNDAKVATTGKDVGVHKEVPAKPTSGAAHPGWRQGARLAFGLGDLVHGTFSLVYLVKRIVTC